jgi:hypothetical protein
MLRFYHKGAEGKPELFSILKKNLVKITHLPGVTQEKLSKINFLFLLGFVFVYLLEGVAVLVIKPGPHT